ncbi:phage NrS-1 polymerase family protein [Salinarchaeum laminariae]|uniref:phage NrS-1 polymerase family protein n=1 Tax=Salinarchaeum laminariae TaxID=869888 RepID=UPI0035BF039A
MGLCEPLGGRNGLCWLLAFWTQGEETKLDRLFQQSGLVRPKCEEIHYADGATYGERTIERAIETTAECSEPSTEPHEPVTGDGMSSTTTDPAPADRSTAQFDEESGLLREWAERLESELQFSCRPDRRTRWPHPPESRSERSIHASNPSWPSYTVVGG